MLETGTTDDQSTGPGSIRALRATAAVLALALVGLAVFLVLGLQRNDAALERMSQQVRDMSAQQTLLAARLDASPTTSTEPSSQPAAEASSVPEQSDGSKLIFAKILGSKPNARGWDIEIRVGTCLTGQAAFSLATSRGELPVDGYYIVDESTSTVQVRVLKATPVVVAGWNKSTEGTSSIDAADLIAVLPGGVSPKSPWDDSWYWLDIKEMIAVSAQQYLGPVAKAAK